MQELLISYIFGKRHTHTPLSTLFVSLTVKPRTSLNPYMQRDIYFSFHLLLTTLSLSRHQLLLSLHPYVMYKHHQTKRHTHQVQDHMIMRNQVQERFSDFYEKWLLQQDSYLKQFLIAQRDHHTNHHHHPTLLYDLDSSSDDQFYRALISKLMNHYKEYYSTKWAGAHEDILAFFCPPWFTPLENAYLWITDWKPSILYRLIHSLNQPRVLPNTVIGGSLINLTGYQLNKIEELKLRTGLEEKRVDREMERQQMSLADRKMVELARLTSHRRVGNVGEINNVVVGDDQVDELVQVALNGLLGELEKVVKTADCVRLMALKGVLEVLTPLQSVDFMAAFLVLQFQLRRLGKRRHQ